MDEMSPEAAATIPVENARRARLYDALWNLAYQQGSVTLSVVGTHDTTYMIEVRGRAQRMYRGSLEEAEKHIAAWQGGEVTNAD